MNEECLSTESNRNQNDTRIQIDDFDGQIVDRTQRLLWAHLLTYKLKLRGEWHTAAERTIRSIIYK